MSYPVYYVEAGDTLPILFDSFDGGTGASVTMTGLAVTDIEIYKDGGTTQRASDAGYTLLDTDGIDFDSITGIHGFSINLSDNTDAGFYAVGSWYHVVVSSVTIDGQTVSFIAAAFRIVSATRGLAGTALPDAAADAAGGLPISDAGGLDLDAKVGALTFTVAGDVDVNVQSWKGAAAADMTGDAYARLGAPAGASVSADIAAIEAQTDDIGAAGAGLTAIPWNAAWDAEVQSEATDALNAYDPPTKAELDTAVANVSVDEIQATALADLFNTDSGDTYAGAVAGSVVKEIADNAGGSALTEAGIADAVWDEALSGHTGSGSAGEALAAAGTAGDPWTTAIPGAYGAGSAGYILGNNINAPLDTIDANVDAILADTNELQTDDTPGTLATIAGYIDTEVASILVAVDTEVAAILADTNELQTDLTDGGRLDLIVDAILADTNELQTDDYPTALTAIAGYIDTEVAAILEDTGTTIPGLIDALPTAAENADAVWDEAATGHTDAGKAGEQLWTDVDAILADTNELQTDDYPTALTAITGYIDTEVASILAAVDTEVAAILADTNELQTDLTNGGRLDLLIDAILADTNELQTDDIPGAIAALNNISAADVNAEVVDVVATDVIADSVAADGSRPTMRQALLMLLRFLTEKSVSSTTLTINKEDGTTPSMTFTLNDDTNPSAITRAS